MTLLIVACDALAYIAVPRIVFPAVMAVTVTEIVVEVVAEPSAVICFWTTANAIYRLRAR